MNVISALLANGRDEGEGSFLGLIVVADVDSRGVWKRQ
jgi:hypothetical protein